MIVDSSTLILLAKSGLLDIFIKHSKERLVITDKVKKESTEKESFDAKLIKQRIKEKKILIEDLMSGNFCYRLLKDFNLGVGEAESIALVSGKKGILLSNDRKAIDVCKIFNIKFTTALNILIALYRKKRVNKEKANIIFDKLKRYGRYSEEIIKKIEGDLK